MKIIGIVGSRRRNKYLDFMAVKRKFFELYKEGDWICSGGCGEGADAFAHRIHQVYHIPYLEFPANWERYGKKAGFLRNTDIAKCSDILIACVTEDRKGGTEDTIKKFLKDNDKDKLYLV